LDAAPLAQFAGGVSGWVWCLASAANLDVEPAVCERQQGKSGILHFPQIPGALGALLLIALCQPGLF
jgi:hypothetical protein